MRVSDRALVRLAAAMVCVLAMAGGEACFGKEAPQPGATPAEILSDWLMQDVGKDGLNKCDLSSAGRVHLPTYRPAVRHRVKIT